MDKNIENKTQYQAELFANMLRKKYKPLKKWARKNRISCYRVYDRDIPEIPVSLDVYELLPSEINSQLECARFMHEQNAQLSANNYAVEAEVRSRIYAILYLYERPYEKDDEEERIWLNAMAESAAGVLGIEESHFVKKMRSHKSHKNKNNEQAFENDDEASSKTEVQYQKNSTAAFEDKVFQHIEGNTQELGQIFHIDLTTYLDTGLFLDHRALRAAIRDKTSKKRVLNLFCYTGSFSVYAAQGNASYVESVDLSNTYLNWAKENMEMNGFDDEKRYVYTKQDCVRFLQQKAVAAKSGKLLPEDLYDVIILDPPTFSNSKSTQDIMDINRDWPQLVKDCLNILNPGGVLYFSSNSERLKFDAAKIPPKTAAGLEFTCEDITSKTIPQDFEGKKPHRCWKLVIEK